MDEPTPHLDDTALLEQIAGILGWNRPQDVVNLAYQLGRSRGRLEAVNTTLDRLEQVLKGVPNG